ncbi:MAG: alpha/beta fold hydrolase, partial [Sphingobacteriales bacterium]
SKNNINKVYAITAYPARAGKFPALLVIHGGSGNASGLRELVEKFARKGYVVMAPDMPGFCNVNHTPHTTGPWKANPEYYEPPRFNVGLSPKNSSLVDAEVAGLEAFNLLCAQPNVDVSKTGITGFSWGGYSTTMLSGLLGKRVKAAYSVWGSGYYDKGSFWKGIIDTLPPATKQTWLTYIDAGRRAGNMKAEYFVEGASNDTYFWPAAVSATLNSIHSRKNHVWGPNVNHTLVASSGIMQELYFDYLLKGEGQPFAKVNISKITANDDGSKQIEIKLKAPAGLKTDTVQLYYSEPNDNWSKRSWIAINAQFKSGNKYYVTIPAAVAAKKISFYAYAVDSRKVRTSSYMYQ